MTEIRFQPRRAAGPESVTTEALIVPVAEGEQHSALLRRLDRKLGGALARHVRAAGFRGQEGQTLLHRVDGSGTFRAVVLAGSGKPAARTLERWRRMAAAAARAARGEGARRAAVFFPKATTEEMAAVAEAIALSGYRFDRYRQPPKEPKPELSQVALLAADLDVRRLSEALDDLRETVRATFSARDLVNEPPSILTAAALAERAVRMCRGGAARVEVMGPREIRRLRLNGLLAVNRGSSEEPRFLRMRYRPRHRRKLKVALVGKGITFDSGGLSLKPAGAMETMKQDMAGAAAVCAVMAAVGRLEPAVEVTAYVAATDNLPSGSAQKPGDVIRYRNGKTVEVLNTDAEGRLVLADALALACEERHDVIIDLATLTGACRIALGTQVAGIMGNPRDLVDRLVAHGSDAGEMLWPLPLVQEYRDELKSSVADLKNVGGGFAGAITAGLFLQEFVNGAQWAHLDIAGPAFADKDRPYCPKGGTGFGVRTLVRYLMSL
ncbi:MAG: leucyl aminopeptidase [Deltaproteobacteria bacterium]|nr:leucyl aminopeptidase [Deltaproteobacteria bacterium]